MKSTKNADSILHDLMTSKKTAAVILAAGQSVRMGGINKQLQTINGIPVLAHTLRAYQRCKLIGEIIVVTKPSDIETVAELCREYGITKLHKIVTGGKTRQESAKCGAAAISEGVTFLAVADGARCLITPEQIAKVCLYAYRTNAASAACPVTDSVKRATPTGKVRETVDRTHLWTVQTPQVFHTALYFAALQNAERNRITVTDDNAMIEALGIRVRLVNCGSENLKITTPADLMTAEAILRYRAEANK